MNYDISLSRNKADYILSITALLQPVLTLLQLFVMDVFRVDGDVANRQRILLTAVPILLSMAIVIYRNILPVLLTYLIVGMVILVTLIEFPDRWPYMSGDVMKFTLPVVIPIGLCIASVKNFAVLIRSMLYVALASAVIAVVYAIMYFYGYFSIEGYDMAFSYALLFPTFVLLSKKHIVWKIIGIFMMLEMLAIGSRGAFLISISYWAYTLVQHRMSVSRILFYAILFVVAYLLFFDTIIKLLVDVFDSIGINSRTLQLLISDELISHDSGRETLRELAWKYINMRPVFGNGVWADRQYFDTYCHNVFLEILLDFGYVGFSLIMLVFITLQARIFSRIPKNHKTMYVMMFSVLLPLMLSSSYLISFNVGMFLGFSHLQSKMHRLQLYQQYQYE